MADPHSTTPRPVESEQGTFHRTEFRDLQWKRDYFAYHATECARVALAELNMCEIEAAKRILLSALSLFDDANRAINKFQKEHARHGNSAA